MLISRIWEKREIRGLARIPDVELTVFLGVYNASPYFKKIEGWLERLNLAGANLVVVDNASTDGTWDWIHDQLIPLLGDSWITSVRNPINVGGYGSLALNLDLVEKSKWLMTLHQDDSYSPDHVLGHLDAIQAADNSLGMISSEATSFTPNGDRLSYPRGAWLLGSAPEPADVFLAHLRSHSYPFSGASFRGDLLNSIQVPWHSTSFPDTEIVLRAAACWRFAYLSRSTVQYLENPTSESHALDQSQIEHGVFLALVRVFRSYEFARLVDELNVSSLDNFALGINSALRARLSNPSLLGLLQAIAQESLMHATGPIPASAFMLAGAFRGLGDHQASSTLDSLSGIASGQSQTHFRLSKEKIIFSDHTSTVDREITNDLKTIAWIPTVLGDFPKWISKIIYLTALKLAPVRRKRPDWDFRWKK